MSLIPIVVLGFGLGKTFKAQIRDRNIAAATRTAQIVSSLAIMPRITNSDLKNGLSPGGIKALDAVVHSSVLQKEVARIRIWNVKGTVVYSDDHSIVGKTFPASTELSEALHGEVASEVSSLTKAENADDRKFGSLLEVYVPIRFSTGAEPAGSFELYLPYAPIAATIHHDTVSLYLMLAGGLLLLYAVLFRIVIGASRRLRRQAAENRHQALHDTLTDLPNRALFNDRVRQALLIGQRDSLRVAVMLIDLDRFKEINDTLGHHNGDILLTQIGPRLQAQLRESDTVARLGGDEFGVLLPDVADRDAVTAVAQKIRDALNQSFVVQELTLDVEASIGIALFPEHGEDADTLLQKADVAMYVAKEAHGGIETYSSKHDQYSPTRLSLLGELRKAITDSELVVYYQPQVNLRTGTVIGAEALIRWEHPYRGLLSPAEFVPLAEHTGLIRPFTLHIIDRALQQCRAWRDEGLDLTVSVNLSARNLLDTQLPADVQKALEWWEVPASSLKLELTESTIMADPLRAMVVLGRLRAMGVRLSIDDFGTGYSSLAYLKQLPVTEIKIDRSFVTHMDEDDNDEVIVRSTIDLGRNLGLEVVAEGIETAGVEARLRALGCEIAQGFHFAKPLPAAEFTSWVRQRQTQPSAKRIPSRKGPHTAKPAATPPRERRALPRRRRAAAS